MVLSLGLLSGFLSARGTNPDERGGNDDRSDMVDGEGGDKDSGNGWGAPRAFRTHKEREFYLFSNSRSHSRRNFF